MDSNNLHRKLGVQGIPYKVFVDAEGNFIKESMGSSGPEEDYKMVKNIIEKHKDS
jgi:thioredoxin-related protein